MTKKTRTFLFLIVSFFFVLGAVSAVFYAQGYRFDFNNFKYLKTGGIFVKVSPSNAKVFLDGKLIGRTQFINDYLFSQSLLPKEYSLLIEKEGYSSWSKTFQVKETEVIEAKNIILFPKEIFFSQIKAKVDNFYPVDGEKIIVQKLIEPGQPEEFSIYDPEKEEGARLEKINLFL
ncbi:MAG: PEGA domain-containing protein, partial [Candidatus Pacebacteria bacterium]|nr:PEGA domain-containing protein [Candidatus Paceibacterota bacterium]